MSEGDHTWRKLLQPLYGVVGLLLIWQIVSATRLVDPFLLPSVSSTAKAVWVGFTEGPLLFDLSRTVERTMLAFAFASVIAVPVGIALGAAPAVYEKLEFVIDFFRSTPASAVFPLFLVLFGAGNVTKIAVAAFGAGLVILFNAAYGVINARKTRVLAAKVMGVPQFRILTDIMLWEALPQIIVGMRNGVSIALIIVIVAEMFIGSVDGLGYRIFSAQMLFDMPTMYGAIFITGALGYVLNLVFVMFDKYFVHWSGK